MNKESKIDEKIFKSFSGKEI